MIFAWSSFMAFMFVRIGTILSLHCRTCFRARRATCGALHRHSGGRRAGARITQHRSTASTRIRTRALVCDTCDVACIGAARVGRAGTRSKKSDMNCLDSSWISITCSSCLRGSLSCHRMSIAPAPHTHTPHVNARTRPRARAWRPPQTYRQACAAPRGRAAPLPPRVLVGEHLTAQGARAPRMPPPPLRRPRAPRRHCPAARRTRRAELPASPGECWTRLWGGLEVRGWTRERNRL